MINKKLLQVMSDKEMDRKEFLKFSGIALISLVGLKGIANLLLSSNELQTTISQKESASRGFGSGKYGA